MKRLFNLLGFPLRLHLTLGGHKLFSIHFFLCLYWIELKTQLKPRDAVLCNAQKHQDWLCFVVTIRLPKSPPKRSDNFIAENSEAANFFFPTFRRNSCEKKICISCFCNKWQVRVLRMGLYQKSNTVTKSESSKFYF